VSGWGSLRAGWSPSLAEQAVEADVREELEAHLALAVEDGLREGLDEETARARAFERFGDFEGTVRGCTRLKTGGGNVARKLSWILVAVLAVGLMLAMVQSRANQARAEAAMAEMRHAMAVLQEERQRGLLELEEQEPRPVIVGLGDELELVDAQNESLNFRAQVAGDGTILLPEVGHIEVVGLSRPEVEAALRERYAAYFQEVALFVRVHPAGRDAD